MPKVRAVVSYVRLSELWFVLYGDKILGVAFFGCLGEIKTAGNDGLVIDDHHFIASNGVSII